MRTVSYLIVLLALVASRVDAATAYLPLAPMVGHTTSTSTRIWAKASGEARLGIRVGEKADLSDGRVVEGPALTGEADFMGQVGVEGLKPATRYYYAVMLDGELAMARPYPSFVTAPAEGERGRTRFAFSSCVGRTASLAAATWGEMAERLDFDLLLLLGDNHYADTTAPAGQRKAYYEHRAVAGYRQVSQSIPTYGIWDDHDYGPNNSDGTARGKERSLRTFGQFFANPSYGLPEAPGVFFSFSRGGIDFFMLDSRYHRTPDAAPDGPGQKTMLGARQLEWLKQSLKASKAPVKVIGCGSEWQSYTTKDCWGGFLHERNEILDFIRDNRITGVLLISGDRHFTAAYQVRGELIEVTAGPLGSRNPASAGKVTPEMFLNHPEGKFYCVYDIDTAAQPHPTVVLEVYQAGKGLVTKRPFTWAEITGAEKIPPLPATAAEAPKAAPKIVPGSAASVEDAPVQPSR